MAKSFKARYADPGEWATRALAFMESIYPLLTPDTEYEKTMNGDDWFLLNGMDASKQRYANGTICQLKEIINGERKFPDVLVTEMRVDWAAEAVKKLSEEK